MRSMLLFVMALMFCGTAIAAQSPKLFKGWNYDSPVTAYSEAKGFYDCSAEFGAEARCIDETAFLGHDFGAGLVFTDGSLSTVTLVTDLDEQIYFKAIGGLARNFTMVLMRGGAEQLDLVAHSRNVANEEEFTADISSFESVQLSQGQLSYFFIEQPANAVRASSNAHAATMNAPDEARSAELMVIDDGIDSLLMITFSIPKLALNKATDSIRQAPEEDF